MSKPISELKGRFFLSLEEVKFLLQLAKRRDPNCKEWTYLLGLEYGVQCNICLQAIYWDEITKHGREHIKHIIPFM